MSWRRAGLVTEPPSGAGDGGGEAVAVRGDDGDGAGEIAGGCGDAGDADEGVAPGYRLGAASGGNSQDETAGAVGGDGQAVGDGYDVSCLRGQRGVNGDGDGNGAGQVGDRVVGAGRGGRREKYTGGQSEQRDVPGRSTG